MKLLLSLKHSRKEDDTFLFWRPNNAGYCYGLESAGQYNVIEPDYHDSENTLPIDQKTMDKLDKIKRTEYGTEQTVIPINNKNLRILKLKFIKRDLRRLETK